MVTSPHVSKGKPNSRSSTIKSGTSNVEFEMKLINNEGTISKLVLYIKKMYDYMHMIISIVILLHSMRVRGRRKGNI